MNEAILIFYLRPIRRKALNVAIVEALSLLWELSATALDGGPLSEQGGLFWITLPIDSLDSAIARLPQLGYTYAVDWLQPVQGQLVASSRVRSSLTGLVRWHRKIYQLNRVYEEDSQLMREHTPDQRRLLLETHVKVHSTADHNSVGNLLNQRVLPVYDARLLVNLVSAQKGSLFLDPFARVGGIVIEALAHGYQVISSDLNPYLQYGLDQLGARHYVADARFLPFDEETFDAIASEPPRNKQTKHIVIEALRELYRVLKTGRRLAFLCAASQAEYLRQEATRLGFQLFLDAPINQKGLDIDVLVWQKEKSS